MSKYHGAARRRIFLVALGTLAPFPHAIAAISDTGHTGHVRSMTRNDLVGSLRGQVDFAQTHVVGSTRRIFDPFLVPNREATVLFSPALPEQGAVFLSVKLPGKPAQEFAMRPPSSPLPRAEFDVSDTFSGTAIRGHYREYGWDRFGTYSYQLPWDLFVPDAELSFRTARGGAGTLPKEHFVFMSPQSDGIVLMNIKGCIFKPQNQCQTKLDQFDGQQHPVLAAIAAREMFSELPVQRLILGMGEAYWPKLVATGPDGKPHVYDQSNGGEWAAFGDKTLSAKVGMGTFWRTASNLGDKRPGEFVAISGQLLDAPSGMSLMPPGVGASCGGSSCNYARQPNGYWHETGHGLGLPHGTPGRYEDWAYRSYDQTFLPNTHPEPAGYDKPVDYLGNHYFGHVLGTPKDPAWATGVASAPLVHEFEALRASNLAESRFWLRYIAPYSHQQMLKVQQRFGTLPAGVPYAQIGDDHRPPPSRHAVVDAGKPTDEAPGVYSVQDVFQLPDAGPVQDAVSLSPPERALPGKGAEEMKGIPVHTLVVTFSDPSHNADGVNQVYPAIRSNYGNAFMPEQDLAPGPYFLRTGNGACMVRSGDGIAQGDCTIEERVQMFVTATGGLGPYIDLKSSDGSCLDFELHFIACDSEGHGPKWRGRHDLTADPDKVKIQGAAGRFITPDGQRSYVMKANSNANLHLTALDRKGPYDLLRQANGKCIVRSGEEVVQGSCDSPDRMHFVLAGDSTTNGPEFALKAQDGSCLNAPPVKVGACTVTSSWIGRKDSTESSSVVKMKHGVYYLEPTTKGGYTITAFAFPAQATSYTRIPEEDVPTEHDVAVDSAGQCMVRSGSGIRQGSCDSPEHLRLYVTESASSLGPNVALKARDGSCLSGTLTFVACPGNGNWRGRKDLTGSDVMLKIQGPGGRFITPDGNGGYHMLANGSSNVVMRASVGASAHAYDLDVRDTRGVLIGTWHLYDGVVRKDSLMKRVVNVPSSLSPATAVLKVDRVTVFTRTLEANTLPPAIRIGAEYGYPAIP